MQLHLVHARPHLLLQTTVEVRAADIQTVRPGLARAYLDVPHFAVSSALSIMILAHGLIG